MAATEDLKLAILCVLIKQRRGRGGRLTSSCHNKELRLGNSAIDSIHGPLPCLLVELGSSDNRLESAVLAQVKNLVGMVEVSLPVDCS